MARENYENEAFTADYFEQYDDTISNGEARIPICFCIDTSTSMDNIMNKESDYDIIQGSEHVSDGNNVISIRLHDGVQKITPMTELRKVMKRMIYRMQNNPVIRNSAVICIITFDQFADCVKEFSEVRRITDRAIDDIRTHADMTNTSQGIRMALERLERFRHINNQAGNESYKPVFILMSDGKPTDGNASENAGVEIRNRSEEGKLNVIPIAIGNSSQGETYLRRLSRDSKVYRMKTEEEFDEVFKKITQRISRTATVISVDEDLAAATLEDAEDGTANESSTQYGTEISDAEFMSFLDDFVNS